MPIDVSRIICPPNEKAYVSTRIDQRDQQHIELAMMPETPPQDGIVSRSQMELRQHEVNGIELTVAAQEY